VVEADSRLGKAIAENCQAWGQVANVMLDVEIEQQERLIKLDAVRQKRHGAERFRDQVAWWKQRVFVDQNLLDPDYPAHFLKARAREIVETHKLQWLRDYHQVLQDTELVGLLYREAPEVLEWLNARVAMVREAEWLLVTSQATPAEGRETY